MSASNIRHAALLFLTAGCGGVPLLPAMPEPGDGFVPASNEQPGVDEDPPLAMSLYPGDVVTLRVDSLETTEIEGLTADERGMLHIPLAGDVAVRGLPLVEAENAIEQALSRFDRSARVTVILSDPRGQQATVIGAVTEQGRVAIVPGMRLADLLAAAGGPSSIEDGAVAAPSADLTTARLVREGQALPISVALAVSGDPRHNVRVRAGDHLYVPPQLGSLVTVLGEVDAARVFPHQPGLRLSQALAMAGGITRDANGGDIHVLRGISTSPRHYRAAIDHVVTGRIPDPVLAPGDVIYVGSSALADFRDVMAAMAPLITIAATTAIGITAGMVE
jgi:protein involved in polysaccharide export with SLBB domain